MARTAAHNNRRRGCLRVLEGSRYRLLGVLGAAEVVRPARGIAASKPYALAASLIAGGGLVAYMYLRKAKVIY